ncbi:MAG: helix-turn-helix domain protein [Hyphomicrobiales bacterium]|nr:helix-turn-helix domain protein [Hyphomicrobiales bacterium]
MSARSNTDPEALTGMLPLLAETIDTLPAEIFSWQFGDNVLTRAAGSRSAVRRWRCCPGSRPGYWCVLLACSRSDRGISSVLVVSPSEALNISSLLTPFDDQAAALEILMLFLPKEFGRKQREFEWVRRLDTTEGRGALLAGYMKQLARQLPHIPQEQAQSLAVATRTLVDACLSPVADQAGAAEPPSVSALVERARLIVRENMASPEFCPKQLVRLLGISRSKLYRLLDSAGGVASFINRERLAEAHRRLATSSDAVSIHVIGSGVGFPDHSSFSRAFRREFGSSPTEAREKALTSCKSCPSH